MEEKLLRPRTIAATTQINAAFADQAKIDVVKLATGDLTIALQQQIMSDHVEMKTWEVVEEPLYESGKHHYLDSLPHGFRRRFLAYFWGIDDSKPLFTQKRHVITMDRWVNLPQVPAEFGLAYFEQKLDSMTEWVQ